MPYSNPDYSQCANNTLTCYQCTHPYNRLRVYWILSYQMAGYGRMNTLNEHFRRALLHAIPCAVFILDEHNRIAYWNPGAEDLTGYNADEVVGLTRDTLQSHLCIDTAAEHKPNSIDPHYRPRGCDCDTECEIRRKDGQTIPIVRKSQDVFDDSGTRIGSIEALVDVSGLKTARSEVRMLKREIARSGRFDRIIGSSSAMQQVYEIIGMVSETDAGVVIQGETGTGKELVARTIHERSTRSSHTFLAVNCGALPDALLEAELFGHVRGAFTGAVSDRAGHFEEAHGGTLFLDEVAELPLSSQVKLLRVLQEHEITRVGESTTRKVDVRIIAATNNDLGAMVRQGSFREDLYYRLHVVGITLPPLRDRTDDIPDLVAAIIQKLNNRYDKTIDGCMPEVLSTLTSYSWPGNVRELEHVLEHAFVVTPRSQRVLTIGSLPEQVKQPPRQVHTERPARSTTHAMDERSQVTHTLAQAGGNKAKAARMMGITRAGLYKKLRRLGLHDSV